RPLFTADGEVRQAAHRLGEFEGNRFDRQTYVALNHEMQMRPGAVAGVARPGDRTAGADPLAFAHGDRALHQVQVDTHGAVVMQDAHEVACRVVAAPALLVLHLDHHAATRRHDGRAFGHGDIHRIAALGREMAVLTV